VDHLPENVIVSETWKGHNFVRTWRKCEQTSGKVKTNTMEHYCWLALH